MIFLPRWIDDELHGHGWAFASLGLMAVALAAWLLWAQLDRPGERVAPAPVAAALPTAAAAVPVVVPPPLVAVAQAASEPLALPACPHQHLDLTDTDGLQRGCVSATRSRQTGSVRSYVVEPEGVSGWRLVIDAAGGEVISARFSRRGRGTTAAAASP